MDTFNNKTAARLISVMTVILCILMTLTLSAFAAAGNTVTLGSGGEAVIKLDYPQAAAEKVSSMQISLEISGGASAEFIADSSLTAKIIESRFHSDTGVLNVYLAGTEPLFPSSGAITLGKVKISSGSGTVSIVEDSVRFVRGSELVSYTGSADITVQGSGGSGSSGGNPTQSSSSSSSSQSSSPTTASSSQSSSSTAASSPQSSSSTTTSSAQQSTPTSSSSQSSSSAQTDAQQPPQSGSSGSGTQGSDGDDLNPPDTSALTAALTNAGSFKRGEYTESSYSVLVEAINNANAVISDQHATQDMVDEALLILENAIGALTLNNNASSGGSTSSGSSVSSSSGESSSRPADSSDDGQSSSGAENSSGSSESSQPSDEEGGVSPVLIIVIIMIVLAAAAIVLIVLINYNKKNSSKGKRG